MARKGRVGISTIIILLACERTCLFTLRVKQSMCQLGIKHCVDSFEKFMETTTRDFWIQRTPPSRAGTVVSSVETQLGRIARSCRELALRSTEVLGKFELLRYFEQAHIFNWH